MVTTYTNLYHQPVSHFWTITAGSVRSPCRTGLEAFTAAQLTTQKSMLGCDGGKLLCHNCAGIGRRFADGFTYFDGYFDGYSDGFTWVFWWFHIPFTYFDCGNGMTIPNDQWIFLEEPPTTGSNGTVQQRWLSEALEMRKRKQASQGVWNITCNSRRTWNGCRLGRSRDTLLHNSPYIFFHMFLVRANRQIGWFRVNNGSKSISDIPSLSYQTYYPYHIRHTILIISDMPSLSYQTYHPYYIWHTILIISDIPPLLYLTYHPYHIRHTILRISDIPSLLNQTYHPYHIRHTILIISDTPSSSYLTYHPYHIRHTIPIISDIPSLLYLTYHPYHIRHTILYYIWHTILIISDIPSLSYQTYHPYYTRHTILIISDIPSLSYQTYHPYYIWHTILIISDIPSLSYQT